MSVFWPLIKDFVQKSTLLKHEWSESSGLVALGNTRQVKVQYKTVEGAPQFAKHNLNVESNYLLEVNPAPNAQVFRPEEVSEVTMIFHGARKVKINGRNYCLKSARWGTQICLKREIMKLDRMSGYEHVNVIRMMGLLANEQGKCAGALLPLIRGHTLLKVSKATDAQKRRWKDQLRSAMEFLHSIDIVWGDANPNNVMVDAVDDKLVLIDFEGGYTSGHVDADKMETKEGDLQGLERIIDFIDRRRSVPSC